jgi:hypothetical protein
MPIYTALQTPSYDLNWLQDNDDIVLVAGGGGASKTGIPNIVQVARQTKSGKFTA